MELKQIKELMATMGRTGIKRLVMKREGFELELEKETNSSDKYLEQIEFPEVNPMKNDIEQHRANISPTRATEQRAGKNMQATHLEIKEDENATFITSPMVGTFYASASPEDPHYVKVGDFVEKNTVVCIVEAMKVMNEVKANMAGAILEVLVENGQPVEFGTKLFKVSPK